ncbi:hypothetical protein OAP32_03280 [Crocinitomicaceae bacterium]|nr:hypothetical protein [Crocinitomicaceae bacterium]
MTRRRVIYDAQKHSSHDKYPILRIPERGTIVRSSRSGGASSRGPKEKIFEQAIIKHFGEFYTVSGQTRINTGSLNKPFELDISLINKIDDQICINVEIDEPYKPFARTVMHCKGDDVLRDEYFTDRGWVVLRFSERQLHSDQDGCLKCIAEVLNLIDTDFKMPESLKSLDIVQSDACWSIFQAQRWEKESERELYLDMTFVPEKQEGFVPERTLNANEQDEEALVRRSFKGIIEPSNNEMNPYARDERIEFSALSHSYFLDGIPVKSSSFLVSRFFTAFDSYSAAKKLRPSNPLFGKSIDAIVSIWANKGKEASDAGTLLHEQIERYYKGESYEPTDEFGLFLDFANAHADLKPFRCEWRIFDESYHIAGTVDFIAKNKGLYEMYDWKRSKKVVDSRTGKPISNDYWGKTGIGQLKSIDDTSYNHYCLQQSLYKYILEKNYDLQVSKMYLVVIHPDYERYIKVEVPYLKNYVEYMLNTF